MLCHLPPQLPVNPAIEAANSAQFSNTVAALLELPTDELSEIGLQCARIGKSKSTDASWAFLESLFDSSVAGPASQLLQTLRTNAVQGNFELVVEGLQNLAGLMEEGGVHPHAIYVVGSYLAILAILAIEKDATFQKDKWEVLTMLSTQPDQG